MSARRAVLVCHPLPKVPGGAEFTYWDDTEEARQAAVELTTPPCGPLCIGVHTVVNLDAEREPRRMVGGNRPMPAGSALNRVSEVNR